MKILAPFQSCRVSCALVVILFVILPTPTWQTGPPTSDDSMVACCKPPNAFFDCTGSGHPTGPGKMYTCVDTSELTGCMTCLVADTVSEGSCSSCCSIESESGECQGGFLASDWEFYVSTLFFVCLCCCFSVLCGFTEVRRKKKGISFAEAWSIPQAMPVLRTWPRRSVSVSDAMPELAGEGEGWTPLSEDEDDLKRYPVAGLVDDTGMAYGFVASMPQSILGSVSATLRRQGGASSVPLELPQEPELTVWISRDGATARPGGFVGAAAGQEGSERGARRGEMHTPSNGDEVGTMANNLQQPLMGADASERVGGIGREDAPRSLENQVEGSGSMETTNER